MRTLTTSLSQDRMTQRERGISLHSVPAHRSSTALHQIPKSPSSLYNGGPHRSYEKLPAVQNPDLGPFMTTVLHISAFESFIEDSEGLDIFRTWIQSNQNCAEVGPKGKGASLIKLDRWKDELDTQVLLQELRTQSEWVHLLYYSTPPRVRLTDGMPDQIHRSSSQGLLDLINLHTDLASSRSWLLQSLYADEFQRFVTSKLVRLTTIRLKENLSGGELGGLGEAFLLTNPAASDNPIVRASLGFRCLGRNFRFLYVRHFVLHQMHAPGPGTYASAVQRIKSAIESLRPHVELIISYRRDGTPLYCLFNITPIFDLRGRSTFLLVGIVSSESLARGTDSKRDLAGSQQTLNPVESVEKDIAVSIHEPIKSFKRLSAAWVASLNRKSNQTTTSKRSVEQDILKLEAEQVQKSPSPKSHTPVIENTYPKAILFSRPSLSIVSASRGALTHLGITTNAEYHASMFSLSKMKITDLVNGSTPKLTQILRSKIIQAINRGEGVSCTCTLGGFTTSTSNPGNSETMPSQNMLSRLQDKDGALSSYVVIIA
ncbi:hypothetical protein DFH28DRAFT_1085111 [Melampsora americana]|nr:hypothetical protein DFH28DRAFT_1085111 [Melampsora americana]